MSYQGHHPDGSGVQRHSAGDLYPYVVFAKETPGGLRWGYIAPNGRQYLLGGCQATFAVVARVKAAAERRRRPAANDARSGQLALALSCVA